jgi:hypothetical protein
MNRLRTYIHSAERACLQRAAPLAVAEPWERYAGLSDAKPIGAESGIGWDRARLGPGADVGRSVRIDPRP